MMMAVDCLDLKGSSERAMRCDACIADFSDVFGADGR